MRVTLKPYVAYRDYHSHAHGAQPFELESGAGHCCISGLRGRPPLSPPGHSGQIHAGSRLVLEFLASRGSARGLDARRICFSRAASAPTSTPQLPMFFIATAETEPRAGGEVSRRFQSDAKILAAPPAEEARRHGYAPWPAPPINSSCAGARPAPRRASIIAGYPWFADWGRDTMISLPGLATVLGRYDIAANILKTYAALRRSRHAAESLSGRRRGARVQHGRCDAVDVSCAR